MNRVSRAALVVGATAALAVGAGCGNGEQNDYVGQVNDLQTRLGSDLADAGTSLDANDPKAAVKAIGSTQDLFSAYADDLEAIEAPDEVADLHDQLAQNARDTADRIASVEKAMTSGDADKMVRALQRLGPALQESDAQSSSLIDEINAEFGS